MGRSFELTDGRSDLSVRSPLIVAMHGFLGTASNMRKKSRFDALARKHGLVIVYPNGKRRRWNDGRSPRNRVDDVAYLTALIKDLISKGSVDPSRVYLAGHSNGGGMAMRLACEASDLVRGISVVATKSPTNFQCAKGASVPAMFFHGTEDPISPHAGRPASSRLGEALSGAETLRLWKARNRCQNAVRTTMIDKKNDGTSVEIRRYTRCAAPLVYVEMFGHGHDWPRTNGKATRLQGPASTEVDAASLTWWFFDNL